MSLITAEISEADIMRINRKLAQMRPTNRAGALWKGIENAGKAIEKKLKLNISGRILKVRTNRLRGSMGSKIETDSEGATLTIGSGVHVGGRVKYANIHETGGRAGRNGSVQIPARRYLSRSLEESRAEAMKRVLDTLDKGIESTK